MAYKSKNNKLSAASWTSFAGAISMSRRNELTPGDPGLRVGCNRYHASQTVHGRTIYVEVRHFQMRTEGRTRSPLVLGAWKNLRRTEKRRRDPGPRFRAAPSSGRTPQRHPRERRYLERVQRRFELRGWAIPLSQEWLLDPTAYLQRSETPFHGCASHGRARMG